MKILAVPQQYFGLFNKVTNNTILAGKSNGMATDEVMQENLRKRAAKLDSRSENEKAVLRSKQKTSQIH